MLTRYHLVYLATPYSKYPGGIDQAFRDASILAARLLQAGVKVFSPIAHTHPIAVHGGLDPLDHRIWLPFDQALMDAAGAMAIGMLPGWDSSYGIGEEIKIFTAAGKPIHLLDPHSLQIVKR